MTNYRATQVVNCVHCGNTGEVKISLPEGINSTQVEWICPVCDAVTKININKRIEEFKESKFVEE